MTTGAAIDDEAADRRRLARGGGLSFAGSAVSAALGFAATVVITRALGDSGAGQVLQLIAVVTIAMSFGRLGMDSLGIWLLPRLADRPELLRGALVLQLLTAAVGGTVAGTAVALALAPLGVAVDTPLLVVGGAATGVGVVALVSAASLRGLGDLRSYVTVGSVALPTLRVAALVALALTVASPLALGIAWSAPLLVAAAAGLALTARRARRSGATGSWRPTSEITRTSFAYALPRTLSAVLEQGLPWFGVLLAGAMLSSADAGVYGAASRLVAAGLIIDSAIRVVVAPRFSALLHAGRIRETESLYRTAAGWLVLFSAPIYLVLAAFAPLVLDWFGTGFDAGAPALAILCAGAIVTFCAGNVHSLLLMSGRSGWAAANKAVVLALNVAGSLLLLPVLGITGAAIAWAVAMLVDALLATIQVRILLGIAPAGRRVLAALAVPLLAVGLPAALSRWLLGATPAGLAVAVVGGAVLLLVWARLGGRRLEVDDLVSAFRRR